MDGGRFRGRTTVRCGCGICRVRPAASWAGTVAGSFRWRGRRMARWAVSGSADGAVRLWDPQGQQSRGAGPARELGQFGGGDGGWTVGGFGVDRRCGAALGSAGSAQPRAGPARELGQFGGVDVRWPVGGFGVGTVRCGFGICRVSRAASWDGTVEGSIRGVDVRWPVGGFGVGGRCGTALGSAGSGEPRAGPAR